ncbi:Ger(x)C family spore germination protein [Paenibacillus sp. LMG 31456]|uniref:Ger(X)C family spore germination protein n=1 Tax=Paenibacillus foliorum TaxID=2654974 RepID=A0A972GJ30_9BACL|nr:Ger(x)C family spore germination protein [Paenibacillus foliorum]NOU91714.1 Ger(x)C family spore germination protein [Paenibacillus foliorum]
MSKGLLYVGFIVMIIICLTGCSDRLDMEDASFPLALGLDIDANDKFHIYVTNPVFSKNVKKKSHEISEPAHTLRQSRVQQDAHSPGVFQGRKFQVILVGKRMLQHKDWFRMLDVIFRDSRNTVTDRVIAFDGPVSEIIYLNPDDQPYLPLLLRGMVDTKSERSETVKTTAQELHRDIYEKGITPSISEVKLDENKNIQLNGATLLDHRGKYSATLETQETVLLNILQNKTSKSVNLTLPIPGITKKGPFDRDKVSFNAEKIKTKIKTSYKQDKFRFDVNIQMDVVLTEILFPVSVRNKGVDLEKMIGEQVQKETNALIRKIQSHKIDPVGFGLYARAYQYKHYKEAEDHWGQELANADIQVSVNVSILGMGPVK